MTDIKLTNFSAKNGSIYLIFDIKNEHGISTVEWDIKNIKSLSNKGLIGDLNFIW